MWKSVQNTVEMASNQTKTIPWLHIPHTIVLILSMGSLCSIQKHLQQLFEPKKLSCHDTREELLALLERNTHPYHCCIAAPMAHLVCLTKLPRRLERLERERTTMHSLHFRSKLTAMKGEDWLFENDTVFQR